MRKARKAMSISFLIIAAAIAPIAWGQADPTVSPTENDSHLAQEILAVTFTGSNQMIDAPPVSEITAISIGITEAANIHYITNQYVMDQFAITQESSQNPTKKSQKATTASAVVNRRTADLKEGSLASAEYSRPVNLAEVAMINKTDIDTHGMRKGSVILLR